MTSRKIWDNLLVEKSYLIDALEVVKFLIGRNLNLVIKFDQKKKKHSIY